MSQNNTASPKLPLTTTEIAELPEVTNDDLEAISNKFFALIMMGKVNEVEEMLKDYPPLLNYQNDVGDTWLHFASSVGSTEIAASLIRFGCELNTKTNGGQTALHFACMSNSAGVAKLLVNAGCDTEALNEKVLTPFQLAAQRQNIEVMKSMLEHRYKPVTRDGSEPDPAIVDDFVDDCLEHAFDNHSVFQNMLQAYTGHGRFTKAALREPTVSVAGEDVHEDENCTPLAKMLPSVEELPNITETLFSTTQAPQSNDLDSKYTVEEVGVLIHAD